MRIRVIRGKKYGLGISVGGVFDGLPAHRKCVVVWGMVSSLLKTNTTARARGRRAIEADVDDDEAEEAALQRLNRLFAKAAPIAARENAAALARFHREIADNIRRAKR